MKIIYISNSIIPSRFANSIHVMKMCQAFADNGHDVTLLAPDCKHRYETGVDDVFEYYGVRKNFIIKKLPSPNIRGNSWVYTFFIWLFLLKNRDTGLVYGRFLNGCFVASKMNIPVVFESHVPDFGKKGLVGKLFSSLVSSKQLKFVTVISNALKNMYLRENILPDGRVVVAHDGADAVQCFSNKARLKGSKDALKVGYVGHLYKGKGVEVIEGLVPYLDKNIELHVIGGMRSDIEKWQRKISSEQVFFYGFVKQEKVSSYINALDVCLLPNQRMVLPHGSLNDKDNISDFTSPIKMFDYMAHGKAIIASNLPVLKEVLTEQNAIFCEPDDYIGWVTAINYFNDKARREQKGQKALDDFQQYTWYRRADMLLTMLKAQGL
ncbi:glycosyltransferase [Stutzerimonas kunmingensis]|uniref:glycosyltransferase n=1 Tax=Stutzerimonas kunmingensis TaxID=1211807 RepID=UPI00241FBE8A|nr:glycosyltransferase [Stutzerimonas kunmingensis]